MKAKQVTGAVFNMIFRLVLSIIIILVVYRLAMYSYHLGYMVFADVAKEAEPGRDITIAVDTEDSTMDVAKTLENRGLIDDARVFFLQEMLSEYRGKIQPGVYTLNTSMTAEKMLAEMSANAPSDDKESEDAQTTETRMHQMMSQMAFRMLRRIRRQQQIRSLWSQTARMYNDSRSEICGLYQFTGKGASTISGRTGTVCTSDGSADHPKRDAELFENTA